MAIAAGEIIFALGLASLIAVASSAAPAPSQDHFVAFGYGKGPNGPDHWSSLRPDWKSCNGGKAQSPIDIHKENATHTESLSPLTRNYVDANATLVNNVFNVMLRYEEGVGTVLVDGENYSLQQVHWHTPSEHTIDGERYPVEMHMVHKSGDGKIAVVAILYQLGHADTFLNQLTDSLKALAKEKCSDKEEAEIPAGVVQNKALKRSTRKYYRYDGSLSTPPCTEPVVWSVLGKVREVSQEQLTALQAPLSGEYRSNSRPVQPLNGRTVKLYDSRMKNKADDDKKDEKKDDNKEKPKSPKFDLGIVRERGHISSLSLRCRIGEC